jgi:diaminopimelate epimerase
LFVMTQPLPFVKGHGTENDFVLVPDPAGRLTLAAAQVAAICDRRAGIGGDGILRVVRADADPVAADQAGQAQWFMDYRNSDGSIAEMCGNGLRVFARFLVDEGLAKPGEFAVATRGGPRTVRCPESGPVTVDMGEATFPEVGEVRVTVGQRSWPATAVLMPNPHAVSFVEDLEHAGDLLRAPLVDPPGAFPDGVNVEFVVDAGPGHLALRVHERGSGETRSCGTGVCAVVAAAMRAGRVPPGRCTVDVPGGRLEIETSGYDRVLMTGPAVLVARGQWVGGNDWESGRSAWDAAMEISGLGIGSV